MSVWHEVQIEFARDAGEALIEEHGETPKHAQLMQILSEAEKVATDLPEGNKEESIQLLTRSNALLTQVENKLPNVDAKAYKNFRNKIRNAKLANSQTIEEIRNE